MELRRYRADLHIHSCLSPCGEMTIYPRKIVERAIEEKLDLIAVSDHNSAENAEATLLAARGKGLTAFPGMELTSEEEVHILALFARMDDLFPLQEEVFRNLPEPGISQKNSWIKEQAIVDENDDVRGFSKHCLIGATRFNVFEIVRLIHGHGGLAVASHIDRGAFSLISQLGFIPSNLELDALEISPLMTIAAAREVFQSTIRLPLVRFSDAHRPEEIGRASTDFLLAAPAFEEIRMALKGKNGRRICGS